MNIGMVSEEYVTSVYQSSELMVNGLSPMTCDYAWYRLSCGLGEDWCLSDSPQKLFSHGDGIEILPAWSLSQLLSVMPEAICLDEYGRCNLMLGKDRVGEGFKGCNKIGWTVCYISKKGFVFDSHTCSRLLDALVLMLIRVLSMNLFSHLKYTDSIVDKKYKDITESIVGHDKEFHDEVTHLKF